MQRIATDTIWRSRLERIDNEVEDIRLPDAVDGVDQDEEWCEILVRGKKRRIRFHEYGERIEEFRVLDVGAGNGMVGDELLDLGVRSIIGIDIIAAAKGAASRDRPDVYDDYRVTDLTDLPEAEEKHLRRADANCLTTVAALGFGDIPPLAFAKALDMIDTPGWLAFNLKESFLREQDVSGFSRLIRRLNRDGYIQTLCYRRYQHRISITGEPLFYVAVIARKLKDLDYDRLESLQEE